MSKDISTLLYEIKSNIKIAELGDYSVLDTIETDFLEMLELMKLFLISERDSYYGYFLMNMQFKVNFCSNGIAGIKLNTYPPVFESNPLLLCTYTMKEILYIVCHEIDHVVLNHPAEMIKSNPDRIPEVYQRFNIAADAAVNDRINYEIKTENHLFLKEPQGLITSNYIQELLDKGLEPKSRISVLCMQDYAYYFDLLNKLNDDSNIQLDDLPMNSSDSDSDKKDKDEASEENASGSAGESTSQNEDKSNQSNEAKYDSNDTDSGGSGNDSMDESDSNIEQQNIVTSKNRGNDTEDHNWEAGEDAEEANAVVKEFMNSAFEMMNEETRGTMPGFFLSQVEKINQPPKLCWQKILKKYVGTISANKIKTRTRLNRRQPERFDLSGTKEDKILKIVVAIDTSGSVSDSLISEILNEVINILAKRKFELTVIECDSRVNRVYVAKNKNDIQSKVSGRGGTAFKPVIDYINDNKKYRDALLIYFTDGYGEYSIPKPKTYRNLWVIVGGGEYLSVKESYGTVIKM